jgi:branched-chain amino acid transport system ATP-binding protein
VSAGAPLLQVIGLDVGYGHVGVLRGVDLAVNEGNIVALVGSNGAGKSTLLRAISGLLRPSAGRIVFAGSDIAGEPPHRIIDLGLLHVAEGRRLFRRQNVHANLELGLYGTRLDRTVERQR